MIIGVPKEVKVEEYRVGVPPTKDKGGEGWGIKLEMRNRTAVMKPEEFRKRCQGIAPVQFCPYTKDCARIDLEALKRNTQFLVDFAREDDKDMLILTNGTKSD